MRWIASLVAEVHRILMRGGAVHVPEGHQGPGQAGAPAAAVRGQPDGDADRAGRRRRVDRPRPHPRRRADGAAPARAGDPRLEERGRAPRALPRASSTAATSPSRSPLFNERSLFGAARCSNAVRNRPCPTKHPVIAITGSSGAGTTTVTRTFEHIFRRENIRAAIIEGDSFHRYDRKEMKAKMAEAPRPGNQHFSHFGPEANLLRGARGAVPRVRRDRHRQGRASTCTTTTRPTPYDQEPGTFTPWDDIAPGTDLLFYEGLHGGVGDRRRERRRARRPAGRRRADHQPRVDPEAAPRPERCAATRRRRSSTRSCGACPTTSTTSARSSRAPTSTSSACRWSTPRIRSSPTTSRPPTRAWS